MLIGKNAPGGGGGLLPYKRLMGMCCWMGSHFQDWIDKNGVAFSITSRYIPFLKVDA